MKLPSVQMTWLLVLMHRWLGICLCLMFALWFASGAILMYVPFPSLTENQRLAGLATVDASKVEVAPAAAIADAGVTSADRLRLIQMPDGPVYVIHPAVGGVVTVRADAGKRVAAITSIDAGRIAEQFAGQPVQAVEGPLDYDQWIVHQRFDPYRPLFRVEVGDQRGTVLYISARSGDVVQRTYRNQRVWNYFGAVVHWIYPTFLRKSWAAWDNVVWWLSLVGIAMALAGIVLGIQRSGKSLQNRRNPSISPFRRWFRWHHITGLSVGIFLLTWIFSGWLSMDHGRLFSSGVANPDQVRRYRGIPLAVAANQVSIAQIAALAPVAEAEIVAVGGHSYLIGRKPQSGVSFIRPGAGAVESSEFSTFPDAALSNAVQSAWPDVPVRRISGIPADDSYGRLITEPLPEATRRVVLGDTPPTWIHVDAGSGQIIQVMDRSRRIYRWLFYALHTFDVPGLSAESLIRQVLMLALLAAGLLLSITGAVIGIKRLGRTFDPA
jgi:uncharacterized iron-regulated membrane protein